MIRQNRRIPGTINSTPIHRNRHQVRNQNEKTLPLGTTTCEQLGETKNWKQRVLQDRQYIKQERLLELDLSNHDIVDLEEDLDRDVNLQLVSVINLENNRMTTIASGVFNRLSNLTKLYLNCNHIDKISFPYFKENKLRIIDISNNSLKSLNLQHLDSLIKLDCSNNDISFLTLNPSLQYLKSSSNKLSNIYFLEHCRDIEEIDLSGNQLYDLKFNFKPYIRLRGHAEQRTFSALRVLDCSDNHIQFIEGMQLLPNLKSFVLNMNNLSLTRHTINQICLLQRLQNLRFEDNPLEDAGMDQSEIINAVLSRMPALLTLNGHRTCQIQEEDDDKKSQFSGINEEPYQLFMDSHRKEEASRLAPLNIEWNFTLGDCQDDERQDTKINELSEIQLINGQLQPLTILEQKQTPPSPRPQLQRRVFEQSQKLGLLNHKKEIKLKIAKSASPLIPHHIFFQQYLTAILPLSYVPAVQLRRGADLTSVRRLDASDDEHVIIWQMFENRGGAIYIKKINRWGVIQSGREIFAKNKEDSSASMGFLLNDTSESKFREHCKYNKLIKRGPQDIVGMHPNAFTYFHILVRVSHSQKEDHYQCAYLIQTGQL